MIILGIGGIHGDAAAALLKDGELAAAVEESKLSRAGVRWNGASELPERAIGACLALAQASAGRRGLRCHRAAHSFRRGDALEAALAVSARAHPAAGAPARARRLGLLSLRRSRKPPCSRSTARAISAARSRWRARGTELALEREAHYPDSLGDLYGRVTELLGFGANREEHKVQWLAAGGDGRYRDLFLEIMRGGGDEWPHLDRSFFDAERLKHGGFSAKFFARLGLADGAAVPERMRAEIAAGIQQAVEAAVVSMAGEGRNLCFAGGLGLNALLVSALERCSRFENVFVQPAAGNAGTALGAVLEAWHGAYGETAAHPAEDAFAGAELHRGGNQAGARELQAAVQVPAHRRGDDGDGGGATGR